VPVFPPFPHGLVCSLLGRVRRAGRGDRGATAVEYGLIVALIAAIIAGVVALLGQAVLAEFTSVVNGF
jgi:pilus assembly protein Flp/PilA